MIREEEEGDNRASEGGTHHGVFLIPCTGQWVTPCTGQ